MPRVTPLSYHYSNEPSICDAFDNTHVPYISDTLRIIRSVLKPQFMHYTKCVKYAFLLLSSIHRRKSNSTCKLIPPVDFFKLKLSNERTITPV